MIVTLAEMSKHATRSLVHTDLYEDDGLVSKLPVRDQQANIPWPTASAHTSRGEHHTPRDVLTLNAWDAERNTPPYPCIAVTHR